MVLLWAGVVCAVAGNLLNSACFQLQKSVHEEVRRNRRNESYAAFPRWWAGLGCMVAGEAGNVAAYGMAPAAVVAPLGAVAVVSNAVLSWAVLGEAVTYWCAGGVVCALGGAALVVYSAPSADAALGVYECVVSWPGLGLVLAVLAGGGLIANPLGLSVGVSAEAADTYVAVDCAVASLAGAITVTSAKGLATAVVGAVGGDPNLFTDRSTSWLTYVLALSVVASTALQVVYLNAALRRFGASVVVPVYYVLFTSVSIATGMALFGETEFATPVLHVALFAGGVVCAFAGVFLMNHGEPPPPAAGLQARFRAPDVRACLSGLRAVYIK